MTPRNQALNDRVTMIAEEAIRQLEEASSVAQYVEAEEGKSESLDRTKLFAHQLKSSVIGILAEYAK
jgi:hypothetical protein